MVATLQPAAVSAPAAKCPPMISPRAMTINGIPGSWCIAHVRPQHEKTLADDLLDAGFDFFLPLRRKVYRKPDGRLDRVRFLPIDGLDRYVFCAGAEPLTPGERTPANLKAFLLSQRCVDSLIEVHPGDQAQLKRELSALHFAVVNNPNIGEPDFKPDQPARVTSGAYQGSEGLICRVTGRGAVVIYIETLGQKVTLEIDAACLEPC